MRLRALLLGMAVLVANPSLASDSVLDLSEATLNKLLTRLGAFSHTGVAQAKIIATVPGVFETCHFIGFLDCPDMPGGALGLQGNRIPLAMCRSVGGGISIVPVGEPVIWHWWISDVEFKVVSGSMTVTALVRARIGANKLAATRTGAATVRFDSGTDRLHVDVAPLTVAFPMMLAGETQMLEVDLAKRLSFSIPIEPQQMSLSLPEGGSKSVTGRVTSATPEYLGGKVRVNFNVDF